MFSASWFQELPALIVLYAEADNGYLQSLFSNAAKLQKIELLKVHQYQTFDKTFFKCASLAEITFEGTIGKSIDFQYSKCLTKGSIKNIVGCLSSSSAGQTLTLSKTAVKKAFETFEGANNGEDSSEWITLITPKSNKYNGKWTITLV
jgi:hypothetical protein